MKQKITLILLSILIPVCSYTQTPSINDSLYQKLHDKIFFSKSTTSDIVWERLQLPDNKEPWSIKTMSDNSLYIGCKNGGLYKYLEEEWTLLGLESLYIPDLDNYFNDELLIATSNFYTWDGSELQYLSNHYYPNVSNTFGIFFGNENFNDLYRSTDGCYNWEKVYDVSGSENIETITATTPDSIFMGITKFTGNGGGVYLSIDSGMNWNHFGLYEHFIASMAVDNNNKIYAGNGGHYETGQGGLYKYNYSTVIWDTLIYFPYINSIVFNKENHIYLGYDLSGMADWGGVMHSEDNGETWIVDTAGMGSTWVTDLELADNGILYAVTGYTTKKLYRTILPVNTNENNGF